MLKLCNSIKPNVWYLRSLEKLAIKMWFPFNFAKNLKDRHFVVGGSKNLKLSPNTCFGVSFQKNVFLSFLSFWSVYSERNEIASSTAPNFNNIWLLYFTFSETINLCRNNWLIKIENVSSCYFRNKKHQKGQNSQSFKWPFLRKSKSNGWPYRYDFWRVFRDLYEASKNYNFAVFFKI